MNPTWTLHGPYIDPTLILLGKLSAASAQAACTHGVSEAGYHVALDEIADQSHSAEMRQRLNAQFCVAMATVPPVPTTALDDLPSALRTLLPKIQNRDLAGPQLQAVARYVRTEAEKLRPKARRELLLSAGMQVEQCAPERPGEPVADSTDQRDGRTADKSEPDSASTRDIIKCHAARYVSLVGTRKSYILLKVTSIS